MMVSIRQCSWLSNMKSSILIKAILLNCFYLLGMLIFFKPFFSIDDFLMSNIAYGVYGEQYDYHVTYMNFAYGRFIVFLLKLFPKIPWYAVLFYIWIFTALTLLTYMIFKWNHAFMGMVIVNALLLYFSYEGYIAIQFTKVAGIVAAVALFVVINEEQSSWKQKIIAIGLWIISCMIRYDCARMVLGAWCLVIFAEWAVRIYKKRKKCWKKSAKRGKWILFIIGLYVLVPKLSGLGMSVEEKDFWKLYWKNNDVRVSIQDYAYPGYNENREVYDAIGISENDLYLFSSWNWDCSVMTPEKGQIIKALKEKNDEELLRLLNEYKTKDAVNKKNVAETQQLVKTQTVTKQEDNAIMQQNENNDQDTAVKQLIQKVFSLKNMQKFFKLFPKSFLEIDVCVPFFIIIVVLLCCSEVKIQELIEAVIVSGGMLLLLMYYLYINGRYLQNRVDVGIVITSIVIFLYWMMQMEIEPSDIILQKTKMIPLIVLSMLCGVYFYYYGDYQTPNDKTILENYKFYEQASGGTDIYSLGYCKELGGEIQVFYNVFDVPEIGIARNIIRGNYIWNLLKRKTMFMDIIDNENIYFTLALGDSNELAWETYFSEHSGKDVHLTKIKEYLDKKVYRVSSKSLDEIIDIPDRVYTDNILEAIECTIYDDQMNVSGTVYLKGESGFNQNTYIQIVNRKTGKYELYDTLAGSDETKEYGEDGYFGKIAANISVPEFNSKYNTVYIILEQNGQYYKKRLTVTKKD